MKTIRFLYFFLAHNCFEVIADGYYFVSFRVTRKEKYKE
jgi:hypothetical protein